MQVSLPQCSTMAEAAGKRSKRPPGFLKDFQMAPVKRVGSAVPVAPRPPSSHPPPSPVAPPQLPDLAPVVAMSGDRDACVRAFALLPTSHMQWALQTATAPRALIPPHPIDFDRQRLLFHIKEKLAKRSGTRRSASARMLQHPVAPLP